MKCITCGSDNPDRAKFCVECGGAFVARCTACKVELPAGAKFCLECGAKAVASSPAHPVLTRETPKHLADKIRQSKSAIEGERKQVTVLFADVKGSMELAESLDPEDFSRIMSRFFAILTEGVERFEGFVDKFTGDGIMALFGAPIAHEDHAQRACYAALHLKDEIARYATELKREHGLSFSTRMGLNSGEVVVGTIGDDLRMDYTAQGHTVGLAQRMESLAEPNTCFLSAHTAALAGGYFALDDLGQFQVKGVATPMRVHRLGGIGGAKTRFDVSRSRGLSRFVGRASDLRSLEDAVEQAAAGDGPVVGVVAEAGTGKSRLCFEFLEHCRAKGMRVLVGRAVAHGLNIPFLPIVEVFRAYFGVTGDDDDGAARAKIARDIALLSPNFVETVPLLCEFLGVGDPLNPAPRLDPEIRKRQLIGVIREIIRGDNSRQPTVTMIEDLHWLDAGSAEFIDQMVEARAGAHSLLLLNFRPDYRAEWMQKSWYRQIPLSPLDERTTGELLASLLGNDPSIKTISGIVHARTGGNPFFIEEVVQNLLETGHIEGERGNFRLVTPVEHLDVPSTVNSVLAARIDRLAEREKRLLQTASVIGKDFSEPLLAAVAEMSPDELRHALANLRRAEFVHEQAIYPVAEYSFKHPLTQEVALGSLLTERRRNLHAAVARAIEKDNVARLDEHAALLAHHWDGAGEALTAARWHKRAALWAGITNASDALRHWERVRQLTQSLARSEETLELGIAACQGVLGLGWRLGTPIVEAAVVFEEGRQLAEANGNVGALAALNGIYACVLGLVGGQSDEYWRYSREAARLADLTDDQGLQIAQRAFLGFGCVFSGRLIEGLESIIATEQRLPADPALGAEFTGYSPYLGIMTAHAWILSRLGRFDETLEVCDRAEDLARLHGDNEVLTWLQLPRLQVDICRGDAPAARTHARRAQQMGEKSATPQARFVGLIALGVAHRLSSEWDEAVRVLQEGLDAAISGANRMLEGWLRSELAMALLGRGEQDRAEQEAQAAVAVSRTQHSRYEEARGSLALVQVLLSRPDGHQLVRVDEALERVQALIAETGAKSFQADVRECQGRLAALRGDAQTSERAFEDARLLYTESGAPVQVARLKKEMGA